MFKTLEWRFIQNWSGSSNSVTSRPYFIQILPTLVKKYLIFNIKLSLKDDITIKHEIRTSSLKHIKNNLILILDLSRVALITLVKKIDRIYKIFFLMEVGI